LLLLEQDIAGSLPHLRLSGVEASIREAMPGLASVQHLSTPGELASSLGVVRKHLRFGPGRRTLIAGINDEAVMGAIRAFEKYGRLEFCAAVALGATPQARAQLRVPGTRLIGCVAFFPERYGQHLMRLALEILHKRPVPPVV
jgi:ribose transport system substrate-binding protein